MTKAVSESSKFPVYLSVKDHSVSGEVFDLLHDAKLDILLTYPAPSMETLSEYYKSEDYISHTDSKRNLFEMIYQFAKRYALNKKLKLINSFQTKEKNLLDFGCGTGDFLETCKADSWKITGIEPNEKARELANQKTENAVLDSEQISNLQNNSFDVITLWHVLEHLPNLDEQILEIKRLLKPNGFLLIAVPNFKSHDAQHYKEFWAAYDVPRHLWHFSQTAVSQIFQHHKMVVTKILPMKMDAYYVSLLSEKYKSGSMNPIRAIYRGWLSNQKAKHSGEYSSLIYLIKNEKAEF